MLLGITWASWAAAILRMTSLVDLYEFSVTRLALHYNPYLSAKNWDKTREIKPRIVNQQCVVYSFMCDLCDSGYVGYTAQHLHQRNSQLLNIKTLRLVNNFWQPKGTQASSKIANSASLNSVKENMIVLFTRCFSSRSTILVSTRRLIPFEQNSLFKRTFDHLLSLFRLNNDVSPTSSKTSNMLLQIFYRNFLLLNVLQNLFFLT